MKSLAPNSGLCPLCRRHATLRDSHVIPEFAYTSAYDEKHRLIAFNPAAAERFHYKQKGLKAPLLCDDCERFLNTEYEHPFYKFWIVGNPLERIVSSGGGIITDVDYSRFKLFHLSVLWRASATTHDAFRRVDLGPHAERIRAMTFKSDPGEPWEYPIVCEAMVHDQRVAHDFVTSPVRLKLYGHNAYQFTFCGCRWVYVVSSHRMLEAERVSLRPEGLPVGIRSLNEVMRRMHQHAMAS